jgi:lycopene cyclase domain-containing protein
MSLYLILELVIIAFPLALSFDKKMQFYRRWKSIILSLLIVGSFFLTWDILFTKAGIWGFNPAYHASTEVFNLPLEEWLFFIVIPYASIFIHYSIEFVHPKLILTNKVTRAITLSLLFLFLIIAILSIDKVYSLTVSLVTLVSLLIGFFNKSKILNRYYISFLVIILPFVIFNGIFTGNFIKGEVFWYSEAYFWKMRISSIPLEDFAYVFCLILLYLLCIDKIETMLKPSLKSINENGPYNK